ncbi:MAG: cation-efflux pump, partial [Ruminiclostridium sp.]
DVISNINENLSIHDFRMTDGNINKNLIFDVEVPFGIKESDEEIKNRIIEEIKAYDSNLNVVIEVDKKIY